MPAKGVAISQIILLVLGIIVLAVVAFLLYSNFSSTTGQVDFQKCRAAATNACTACSIASGGNTLNCDAKLYLRTQSDIACAGRGLISGAKADPVKDSATQAVTGYENPTGTISCSEFIGGGGTSNQQTNDLTGKACTPEASTNACTTTGGTGLHLCQSGTWSGCK